MNKKSLLAAFAVLGLSVCCTPSVPEVEETVSQKITASVVDNGSSAAWSKTDVLGVYTDDSEKNVKYTTSSAGTSVSFTASTEVSGTPQYVYYPYSSSNSSSNATGLKGTLPQDQTAASAGVYPYDYRYGVQKGSNSNGDVEFEMHRILSTVFFSINASGSALEGQEITGLTCKVTREGADVPVVGSFAFSAANGSYTYEGYTTYADFSAVSHANVFPTVKAGDTFAVTVRTAEASATVSVAAENDFEAGGYYTVAVALADAEVGDPDDNIVIGVPTLQALSFTVAANPGKILAKEVYYDKSRWTTYREVEGEEMTVAEGVISGCIPYLNDRNLVPAVEYTEGASIEFSSDKGQTFTEWDGSSALDFSAGNVMRVIADTLYTDYVCNITNTGLPVVVVNQPGGDTAWNQIGEYVVSKETDFDTIESGFPGTVTVYNADGTVDLATATAMTRLRGNTTKEFPKKPFAIKLGSKAKVLGMPKHKRWVLLANWKDRSLMRNHIALGVAQKFTETLTDGIPWNVHGEFVELVYNGVHVGNYYLCEQIKIDDNRLNIKSEYDAGDYPSITTADLDNFGYLMECDDYYDENTKFLTRHYIPFQFKDDGDKGGVILNYMQNKVQAIEDNLYDGFKNGKSASYAAAYADLDLPSVVDQLLIYEMTMNSEMGHPRSVYMYMNGTGKLCAGPVWDFDWLSFPIDNSVLDELNNGWDRSYTASLMATASHKNKHYRYQPYFSWGSKLPSSPVTSDVPYVWYPMMIKESTFQSLAAERWATIKPVLSEYAQEIWDTADRIALSWEYNNAMWPAYYSNNCDRQKYCDGGYCGDERMTSFDEIAEGIYYAYTQRLSGMSFVTSKNWPTWTIQLKRW